MFYSVSFTVVPGFTLDLGWKGMGSFAGLSYIKYCSLSLRTEVCMPGITPFCLWSVGWS